jgi:hypothetical protein
LGRLIVADAQDRLRIAKCGLNAIENLRGTGVEIGPTEHDPHASPFEDVLGLR